MSSLIDLNLKGQTSLEFLAMFSFVLLVFASFYTLFLNKSVEVQRRKESYQAELISEGIKYHLRLALAQGRGFSNNFTLPDWIYSEKYNISLERRQENTLIYVDYDSGRAVSEVPVKVKGILTPGKCRVQNKKGVLYVS